MEAKGAFRLYLAFSQVQHLLELKTHLINNFKVKIRDKKAVIWKIWVKIISFVQTREIIFIFYILFYRKDKVSLALFFAHLKFFVLIFKYRLCLLSRTMISTNSLHFFHLKPCLFIYAKIIERVIILTFCIISSIFVILDWCIFLISVLFFVFFLFGNMNQ